MIKRRIGMNKLREKLLNKSAVLGVVGLGYVGLPLAMVKARAGFHVIGFDVQPEKVESIRAGKSYILDLSDEELGAAVARGSLEATCDFEAIRRCDCVCIAVPTPLDAHQQPDIRYVRSSAESIAPYLHRDMLVVLESTTYPGTTEELVKPILEQGGLRCGQDFYLAFSPERVDPGNRTYQINNTPKVVGGCTEECTETAALLYETILHAPVQKVSSPAVAEMEKLLENTYRNINIGLVNELAMLCDRMGISIWEVVDAAKTKPYGFQAFYPGPGLGGHCIPLDPYYLSWKAREYGFHTSMIETSMIINDGMPAYCAQRAARVLNRCCKSLNGADVLVLGAAYKPDINDWRESPAIRLMEELHRGGARLRYYDPFVRSFRRGELALESEAALTPESVAAADLVVVATAHSQVDYTMVQRCAKAVFDTKNALRDVPCRDNVELL